MRTLSDMCDLVPILTGFLLTFTLKTKPIPTPTGQPITLDFKVLFLCLIHWQYSQNAMEKLIRLELEVSKFSRPKCTGFLAQFSQYLNYLPI